MLWEFWNYQSRAKWHYTVPIMERVKIFEMPLPGYFGFPPFALECFTMYVFARIVVVRLKPHSTGERVGATMGSVAPGRVSHGASGLNRASGQIGRTIAL